MKRHITFSAVAIKRQQFIVVHCPFYAETNLLSGSTSSRYKGNDAQTADCVIHISLLHSRIHPTASSSGAADADVDK
jgi:hypothetical protein